MPVFQRCSSKQNTFALWFFTTLKLVYQKICALNVLNQPMASLHLREQLFLGGSRSLNTVELHLNMKSELVDLRLPWPQKKFGLRRWWWVKIHGRQTLPEQMSRMFVCQHFERIPDIERSSKDHPWHREVFTPSYINICISGRFIVAGSHFRSQIARN